ncbi:hypothetical protein RFI_14837 [Reticulomyxa filosa]|uniref:UBP-type domain-containing protein n=1 Tax=Reticulomyxa filosa TaxID=46433 RepID=X6N907_RETFI|nr:hypothetical protein RFI_14837 [Reticulomyxa filosa]|eukprot:ETO22363.1 hypothetical protein RFI_14837 [Reticulomyxa filosa]
MTRELGYSFGNPQNEVISGHLVLSNNQQSSCNVAIIDIPPKLTMIEVCDFMGKSIVASNITHLQVMSQTQESTNNYCVLIHFEHESYAEEFYGALNGKPFNTLEIDLRCQIYYVLECMIDNIATHYSYRPKPLTPKSVMKPMETGMSQDKANEMKSSENQCVASVSALESLPLDTSNNNNNNNNNNNMKNVLSINKTKMKKLVFPPILNNTLHCQTSNPNTTTTINVSTIVNDDTNNIPNCVFCFELVLPPCVHDTMKGNQPPLAKVQHKHSSSSQQQQQQLDSNAKVSIGNEVSTRNSVKWYERSNSVIIVLCYHVFHVKCFMQSKNNACPICRHVMFPEDCSCCEDCGRFTKDLWMCLVCGHIGCGRQQQSQCAAKHFEKTGHSYAKNVLESSKVWDYISDDYVYRMMQNTEDGKLVALQTSSWDGIDGMHKHLSTNMDMWSSFKQENMIFEYNFLLTKQLEDLQSYHKSRVFFIQKT